MREFVVWDVSERKSEGGGGGGGGRSKVVILSEYGSTCRVRGCGALCDVGSGRIMVVCFFRTPLSLFNVGMTHCRS